MDKLILKYKGLDSWGRPVYTDPDGNFLKDVNLGLLLPSLHTTCCFDGEPDTPIEYIDKYKNMEVVY